MQTMFPLPDRSPPSWRAAMAEIAPACPRQHVSLHAAQLLMARGRLAEAEAAYREFIERFPNQDAVLTSFADLLRRSGRHAEAEAMFRRAIHVELDRLGCADHERSLVESYIFSAERGQTPPAAAPPVFVAGLFDRYAGNFDAMLREKLQYRAPEVLFEVLSSQAGHGLHDLDILDLGCGTGLAGALFRSVARRLDGVDLSPGMVEQATEKQFYDRMVVGVLVTFLDTVDQPYDLIVAADVFVYLGDLAPVFAASGRVLRPTGRLAFTVEASESPGYHLQPTRRFVHHRDYLRDTAAAAGLEVLRLDETWTRLQEGQPVRSWVCVLRLDASESGRL
jgi:predicted TPR repeat methyltransferase